MLYLATPAFRHKLLRSMSSSSSRPDGIAADQDPNEYTPLNSNGVAGPRSTLAGLFSKNYTPGENSEHMLVRWAARTFTITKLTLTSNYVNVLLVFVPLGIIAGILEWDPTTVFVLNFFAIVPLAAVLSFATEEISLKLGETLGGLMNATFGNAVELIVCFSSVPTRNIQ